MNKIAVFSSGSGTNAQNIVEYFNTNTQIKIDCLLTNNPEAFVIKRFERLDIPAYVFDRYKFYRSTDIIDLLKDRNIDFIVLAGFLWLIPENLISNFDNRIVNIHPALLPKYGGKGMYGMNVHKAVVEAGEVESGITVHYVNEKYDDGNIIFQATCPIDATDTPEMVAKKVHKLEYEHYPRIIEQLVLS